MPIRKLTAEFVRRAKFEPANSSETGKPIDRIIFWDAGLPSFGLMLTARGHRSWVVQYRAHHASRRLTIDGVLSLNDARKEARAVLGQVAKGGDPVVERRQAAQAERHTLRAIVESYLRHEGRKLRSFKQRRAALERVLPKLGSWPISDIRKSTITALLDDIEESRGRTAANETLSLLGRVMRWHETRTDDYRSPVVRGMARKPAANESAQRSRILDDGEIRAVWSAAEKLNGPGGPFIKLLFLTATRRNELARMEWSEIQGDCWVIPRSRYKTNIDVAIPLSVTAQRVFAKIPRIEGCPYVFTNDGMHPLGGVAAVKKRIDKSSGVGDWVIHDVRRTSRSLLSRAGVNPDTAERCLGHKIGGIRGTCDRYRYLSEMRAAFEALAAQIDAVLKRGR
jgi:integrase